MEYDLTSFVEKIPSSYQRRNGRKNEILNLLNLFHFIDWMMRLPAKAEKAFWDEMQSFEEEKKMKYVSSVEKIGLQKGIEEAKKQGWKVGWIEGWMEGWKEGWKEGQTTFIQKLLNKRFGCVPPDLAKKLQDSELDVLDRFGESILDFKDLEDAENWWDTRGKEGNA